MGVLSLEKEKIGNFRSNSSNSDFKMQVLDLQNDFDSWWQKKSFGSFFASSLNTTEPEYKYCFCLEKLVLIICGWYNSFSDHLQKRKLYGWKARHEMNLCSVKTCKRSAKTWALSGTEWKRAVVEWRGKKKPIVSQQSWSQKLQKSCSQGGSEITSCIIQSETLSYHRGVTLISHWRTKTLMKLFGNSAIAVIYLTVTKSSLKSFAVMKLDGGGDPDLIRPWWRSL